MHRPLRRTELQKLARSQLFVLDLRLSQAAAAIGAGLGGADARTPVLWQDADSALLVFPGETRVRIARGFVFVELTVATDQTGRATLLFPFRVGSSPNEAVATAITETVPRGHPVIAARWANVATPIVWHAVLRAGHGLLAGRKTPRPLAVAGVYTLGAVISYLVTEPVTVDGLRDYFARVVGSDVLPDLSTLNRRYLGTLPRLRVGTSTKRR
jgi:hypothetical protein